MTHARNLPHPWEYSLPVPNDPRAVTVTRRTLRLILTLHGLIGLVDTAELLGTELISNAVLHTRGPAALRLRFSAGVLRIGAWDADPAPSKPPATPEALEDLAGREGGRGLFLVKTCADLWGRQPLSRDGDRVKVVRCELSAA
ncbi:ATP-binding protein [Streptomyces sp. NPDC093260]|uniref:ATP-binding protein n=1 Tax=Streptomyces sp. NPDC093260 TaxID=3155073 RepID=UPI0034339786